MERVNVRAGGELSCALGAGWLRRCRVWVSVHGYAVTAGLLLGHVGTDALGLGREELRALAAVAGNLPIRLGDELDLAALEVGAGGPAQPSAWR